MTNENNVGKKILKVAVEAIDLEKLANGMLDEVLEPALANLVADTTNPFDDAAKAMLYPILSAELKKQIATQVAKLKEHV